MIEGQHFTPPPAARWLARELLQGWQAPPGRPALVIDPACGDGALLRALGEVWPDPTPPALLGVELDPVAAARCAAALPQAEILRGDALALAGAPPLADQRADLVLLNPPYLGQKGRKALFDAAAALGERWARRTAPRMDYLYYFLHLGLDLLRPGGRMMALTTAYWPAATGAAHLRRDLAARARLLSWVSFEGAPLFHDAPGQHNLALLLEKNESSPSARAAARIALRCLPGGEVEELGRAPAAAQDAGGGPWNPSLGPREEEQARLRAAAWGLTLGEVAQDRQGVVSGCDRLTAAHLQALGAPPGLSEGDPGFVLTGDEVAARGWDRDPALRPFLKVLRRGATIAPMEVWRALPPLTAPSTRVMIYLRRGDQPPAALLAHLAPLRALLERRREVQQGKLPWWALHWARRLDELERPKLITARRGAQVAFGLDLAGHVVSSDCTFLLVPGDDLGLLQRLQAALHEPEAEAALRALGRSKGALLEFYSQPLRRWPIPAAVAGQGGLAITGPSADK